MYQVDDIRQLLTAMYLRGDFTIDKTGVKTVEIIGATFFADESYLIRKPAQSYIDRELEWYKSQSLNVNDIPGECPVIWKMVSDENGFINSNYGWCIFSEENGNQYEKVRSELEKNPNSRRASMIYNRPSMHEDYNKNGMSDFMCTFSNQFFIRDEKLYSHYIMRSNDCVFGYCNDYAWAQYVLEKLASDLGIKVGGLIWTASSLHVYEKDFYCFDYYMKTGKWPANKKEYDDFMEEK